VSGPRREELLNILADHLLEHGLGAASLRTLAAAAGTSDRMLLYYFATKEELMAAALTRIAARLGELLDQALPRPKPAAELLQDLAVWVEGPAVKPYLSLWLELAARSARREEPYAQTAGLILDGLSLWVSSRLRVAREADRKAESALVLCLIEGMVLCGGVHRREMAGAAVNLARRQLRAKSAK
jgi:AcrR family transcriptional regulator